VLQKQLISILAWGIVDFPGKSSHFSKYIGAHEYWKQDSC
jgi:hypothetical protein